MSSKKVDLHRKGVGEFGNPPWRFSKEVLFEMLRLRTQEKWTLQEIGNKYNLSKERVRQLIGNTGRLK